MNSNIEVISENLWAVNFEYVKNGYIKELKFNHNTSIDRLAVLTDDGKMILNKAVDYSVYVPFLKAMTTLDEAELNTMKGFYNFIRILIPKTQKWEDEKILHLIWGRFSSIEDCTIYTIYKTFGELESVRRKKEKEFKLKCQSNALFKKIRKGVK